MDIDNSNICDLLVEFKDIKNIDKLKDLFIEKGWNLISISDGNNKHYQLYFGKNVQVDNMYEYAFPYAFDYEETKNELERLIKYRTKYFALEENLGKYIGRKINAYEDIYQFSTGKKVYTRSRCVGIVLGINNNKIDMYQEKNPGHYKFYSLPLDDFKKFLCLDSYKINYSSLSPTEKDVFHKYLEEKEAKFGQLCGDWDYRNIDMIESHLQGISVKDDVIGVSCEKFSPDLDDYVSCSGGDIKDKTLVNQFLLLDLDNREKVLDFMCEIESHIDFDKVNELLTLEEEKEMKEYGIEDYEEELEYE